MGDGQEGLRIFAWQWQKNDDIEVNLYCDNNRLIIRNTRTYGEQDWYYMATKSGICM